MWSWCDIRLSSQRRNSRKSQLFSHPPSVSFEISYYNPQMQWHPCEDRPTYQRRLRHRKGRRWPFACRARPAAYAKPARNARREAFSVRTFFCLFDGQAPGVLTCVILSDTSPNVDWTVMEPKWAVRFPLLPVLLPPHLVLWLVKDLLRPVVVTKTLIPLSDEGDDQKGAKIRWSHPVWMETLPVVEVVVECRSDASCRLQNLTLRVCLSFCWFSVFPSQYFFVIMKYCTFYV